MNRALRGVKDAFNREDARNTLDFNLTFYAVRHSLSRSTRRARRFCLILGRATLSGSFMICQESRKCQGEILDRGILMCGHL